MVFIRKIISGSRSRSLQASPALFPPVCSTICVLTHSVATYEYSVHSVISSKTSFLTKQSVACVCVSLLLCINYPLLEEHHTSGDCICNQDETEVHWEKREKAPQWDFYHPKISWHCIYLWWGRVLIRSSILGIPWAAAKVLTDLSPKTDVFYTPTPLRLFNFSMAPVFLSFSLHFGG